MKITDFINKEKISDGFDALVGILSPETAVKRSRFRALQTHTRLYDAATKGRRGDGWRSVADGPRDSLRGLSLLRQRSRDAGRNNGYHTKAVAGICANAIGTGIVLKVKSSRKNGRNQVADLWKSWSETTACDHGSQLTFAGIQETAMKGIVESGEVLIRRVYETAKYSRLTRQPPLRLQVLEPEFLDESKTSFGNPRGNQIVAGIEFNPSGQRVGYHLFDAHPSSYPTPESRFVPASDILHVYRIDRASQVRGVPWGASVLLNLNDLDGYEDAELLRRKIAACYAAFVTRPELDGSEADISGPGLIDKLEPGLIQELNPGESVTFGNPPQVTGYQEYSTAVLHKIAAGYQIPYSVLTGDYSQVNFSSGRMGWLEFSRVIEQWRWNMFIPRMLDPIWSWFLDSVSLQGVSTDGVSGEWTAPRREMIDPVKEVEAIVSSVSAGLLSMPEAIREAGYDPETQLEEIKAWNASLDAAGVILTSDPRQDPKRLTAENIAKSAKVV